MPSSISQRSVLAIALEKKRINIVLAKMVRYIVPVILVSVPLLVTGASFVRYKKQSYTNSKISPSIRQVDTNSLTQCVTICEHTDECVAISYNSDGSCELNQYKHDDQLSTTVHGHGWNIYEKPQADENKATSLTFGFIKNANDIGYDFQKVYVVSTNATVVTLTAPLLGKIFEGTVIKGKEISLPDRFITPESTGIYNSSLHLESYGHVDVYVENDCDASSDGSVVIPEKHLSNEYIIVIWSPSRFNTEYSVIGLDDNTDINITSPNGTLEKLKLNHDQVYHYKAGPRQQEPGTLISSSKNIAVFAGNECDNVYRENCGHMYEQMPPISSLQKEYIVSFPYPGKDYALRVIAVEHNTKIQYNGGSRKLNSKQYFTKKISKRALAITATNKVMVAIFYTGGGRHDGSMLIVPGLSQFKAKYTMFVPGNVDLCVLMVTYPSYTSSINSIRLNDLKLNANKSVEVTVDGRGTYTILYVEVSKGISEIYTVDRTPFGAYLSFFRRDSQSWFSLPYKF